MSRIKIKDNSRTPKESLSGISLLTSKIADKTLEQLENEGRFVFPEILRDADDITKDQMILQSVNNYYLSKKDRMKAAKIWDKLEQLNAISQPMRNYAEKIHQKKINALESSFTEDKFSVGFGIFILILVLIYYPNYFQLSIILGIICLCYYCWKNRTLERIDLYQMEKSAKKTYNPFRTSFDEFKKQNI